MGIECHPFIAGWWYTYPSEQYESQLGLIIAMYGKKMFQTTDQIDACPGYKAPMI